MKNGSWTSGSWVMGLLAAGALLGCGDDTAGGGGSGSMSGGGGDGTGGEAATTGSTTSTTTTSSTTTTTTTGATTSSSSGGGEGGSGTTGQGGDGGAGTTGQGGDGGGGTTGQGGDGQGGVGQGGSGGGPAGWTCDPDYYAAEDGCDCDCGILDPDCADPGASVYNCDDATPFCDASGACSAIPSWWTCDAAAFDDGATCDCACGGPDPDCEIDEAPITGCADGEACSPGGACVPAEWTCFPGWYGVGDDCDCSCGAYDPDCDDPGLDILGCEGGQVCGDDGTCQGDLPGCENPTVVGIDGTFEGDTSMGLAAPGTSCSSSSTPGLGQAFSFTPAVGGEYAITVVANDGVDLTLAIRSVCDEIGSEVPDTLDSVCEDTAGSGGDETIVVGLAGLTTYTIVVQGYSDGVDGAFLGEVVGPIF